MNTPNDKKPKPYTPSSAPFPYFEIAGMDEHNAQVREYARHTAQTQQNAAMINEIKAINDRLQKYRHGYLSVYQSCLLPFLSFLAFFFDFPSLFFTQ